jgi:hypothetical protein
MAASIVIKVVSRALGIKYAKIVPMPIPKVIKSINESVLPEDRGRILDYVEMLDINLSDPKSKVVLFFWWRCMSPRRYCLLCIVLRCIVLRCFELHCAALRCAALRMR